MNFKLQMAVMAQAEQDHQDAKSFNQLLKTPPKPKALRCFGIIQCECCGSLCSDHDEICGKCKDPLRLIIQGVDQDGRPSYMMRASINSDPDLNFKQKRSQGNLVGKSNPIKK